MQRLHNVRQLGLAHMVFPGANYSRFSHSLGACHNAQRLLSAIERNSGKKLNGDLQVYRLVAMLHDVGHYPFSHATEHVIANFYSKDLLAPTAPPKKKAASTTIAPTKKKQSRQSPSAYKHEPLGEYIIRFSPEIKKILKSHGIDNEQIAETFAKSTPDPLIGIISSDLDCDRLDYLKRTAHNSGAPYGSVDIGFIIDQATIDEDGTFCFRAKAARAADHLLVARYFDYMQVPFHKTVVSLEWSLVSCIEQLLIRGLIDCSGNSIEEHVHSGSWSTFDDQMLIAKFRELRASISERGKSSPILKDHLAAVLDRRPAKMIASWDKIIANRDRQTKAKDEFIARSKLANVATKLSLDINRFHLWTTPVLFSKLDGSMDGDRSEDALAEAVQILGEGSRKSSLLLSRVDCLVHLLSSHQMSGLRVYYLPEAGRPVDGKIREAIVENFADLLGQPTF